MQGELFKLVISGYYHVDLTGYQTKKGEYYIEKDFAELVHIPRHIARKIIQSSVRKPKVIMRNLKIAQANHIRDRIEAAGVSCEVQDMESDFSQELSLVTD